MYGSDRLGSRLSSSQQNLVYGSFERGATRRDGSFERRKYKLRSDAVPLTALSEEGTPVLFPSAGLIGKRKNMYLGHKRYELKNHLGNVMATITDRKQSVHIQAVPLVVGDFTRVLSHYQPEVVSISDYFPGGSILPNRSFSSNSYRFGYQGSEKDDEISGTGNTYTTHFRQLDTRLLRWWGVDPKTNASQSAYMSMGGNPILFNDVLGDTIKLSDSFRNDKSSMAVYNNFLKTRAGKRFEKKFGVGGKYETVNVNIDNDLFGKENETEVFAVNKETGLRRELTVDYDGSKGRLASLAGNERLEFDVSISSDDSQIMKAGNISDNFGGIHTGKSASEANTNRLIRNGLSLIHETQHVRIIHSDFITYKRWATHPYHQHTSMKEVGGKWYNERLEHLNIFSPNRDRSRDEKILNSFGN